MNQKSILAGLALGIAGCGDCRGCDGGAPADAVAPDALAAGTVALSWTITDLNNVPAPCDRVGATTVSLQLRSRTGSMVRVSFGCGSGAGTSQPITPGLYDFAIELQAGAETIASAPPQSLNVRPGLDEQLDSVAFKVDMNGRLEVSIAASPASTNCQSITAGGAGITTNTITLVHTGDGCAPVTFTRTRGSVTVGTYTVRCGSPMVTSCIETDELLTVPSMASGPYTILISGAVNGLTCWQNNDSFEVPPLGKANRDRRNLAFQNVMGCVRPSLR